MLLHTFNRLQYSVNTTFICIGKAKIHALLQQSGAKPAGPPRHACTYNSILMKRTEQGNALKQN